MALPELSNITGLADCLDVVGYNYKEHLYKEDHKRWPNRVLLGSENGKELSQWLAAKNNDFISGQFLWTGIDFLGKQGDGPPMARKQDFWMLPALKPSFISERVYGRIDLW